MTWSNSLNVANVASGSYRSVAGYASESLVVGRALLCGFNLFVKAWRDAKYDAVLDVNGSLFRVEVKGTTTSNTFTTSSGGRTGRQINRAVESRDRPLSTADCDWLIATTSVDGICWVIPVELIEILSVKSLSISQLTNFREKWGIFVSDNPHIKPFLRTGFRHLPEDQLVGIAKHYGLDTVSFLNTQFSLAPGGERSKRGKKFSLSLRDRLVVEIWHAALASIPDGSDS